jgi:hypothetical protein
MSDAIAATLLEVSGGHPRLLQHCLSPGYLDAGFDPETCRASLSQLPFVWRLFTPFMQDTDTTQRLCQLLAHHDVGPDEPYLREGLLRHLYWQNLLRRSQPGKRLTWRCEALRLAGQHILGCAEVG